MESTTLPNGNSVTVIQAAHWNKRISAIERRLTGGAGPYADCSVWLPYTAAKHTGARNTEPTSTPTRGTWHEKFQDQATSINGGPVIPSVQKGTSDARGPYDAHIEKLRRLYPGAWHLIVAADDLARSEHLIRLKVSTNLEIANGTKAPPLWSESNPWEALFRLLVKDGAFWHG